MPGPNTGNHRVGRQEDDDRLTGYGERRIVSDWTVTVGECTPRRRVCTYCERRRRYFVKTEKRKPSGLFAIHYGRLRKPITDGPSIAAVRGFVRDPGGGTARTFDFVIARTCRARRTDRNGSTISFVRRPQRPLLLENHAPFG